MEENESINLLLCLDKYCFDGILITLLSASKNTRHPLNVFIGTGHFKTKKKEFFAFEQSQADFLEKAIQKYNPGSHIHLVDMTEEVNEKLGKSVNLNGKFSPYSMIRLLSDHHEEFGERLLYIDIDVVVTGDLYKIYSEDLSDKDVGMVIDEVGSHWLGRKYCNSGVILMNLKRLRENGHFDVVRKKVIQNHYFMPDQTALNRGLKKNIKIMSPRFNDQHYLHDDTVIRHYCQWIKLNKRGFSNVAKKPWNIEEFRKTYGDDVHKETLEEYMKIKDEYLKTICANK